MTAQLNEMIRDVAAAQIVKNENTAKAVAVLEPAARTIQQAAGRLESLVGTLKDFVQLDQAEVQAVSVETCLEQAIAMIPVKLREASPIEREFSPTPALRASPRELNQIFHTLIKNALEASAGRGVVRLKTRASAGKAIVEVSDSGPGIAEEKLSRLFDLEFREKRGRIGMGLGLPLARMIVERQGGTIRAENQRGAGARITVEWPASMPG